MAKFTKSADIIEMGTENGGKFPVELSISQEKKGRISELLEEMSKLTSIEKIYMHLKLPPCPVIENENKSNSPPSGSAYRTSTTLNWIQTNYIEDRRVCLSKQEVYSHYKLYCDSHGVNPFAMTEFGKVLKTAFPSVHDRRLGQRGKSKYFYGGLRRKSTSGGASDQESSKIDDPQPFDHEEELESLSSQLVCEWASYLLGKSFSSVKSLAQYLVFSGASCGKKAALFNMLLDMDGSSSAGTTSDKRNAESLLQDTQALIQRKILQKEVLKEHKSLVKQQEINQKETQAAHPTAARLAVLSPSLHALHSSEASSYRSSRVHVLNVRRNNSASSTPIVPLRQEMSEGFHHVSNVKCGTVSVSECKKATESDSKACSNLNESLHIDKSIPNFNTQHNIDKAVVKTKQSKLTSSKSLEESNQRQPKRNSDFLHNTNQGRNSKRRRCITSLGMAGLKEQTPESTDHNTQCPKEAVVIRPVSCPVFNDDMQTLTCDMESEDIPTPSNLAISETTKDANDIPDINISSSDNDAHPSKPENSSSPFHFVRKPTVISIKPPEIKENNELLFLNSDTKSCDSNSGHASPVKKTHRIMNSILSSSDSNIPHHFSSSANKLSSLSLSPCSDSQMTDSQCGNAKENDKSIRRAAHTLDNAYLLPCQSSRSAFVRVMNGKGHNRSEIIPRPRHSSFDESFYNGHSKQSENSIKGIRNKLTEVKKASQIPISNKDLSPVPGTEGVKECSNDDFISIATTSSNDRVPTIKSNTSESLQFTSVHLTSPTITSPVNSRRGTSKSPVTPPKRHQPRSRFTPIRPKMIGCCNSSPQKKDMRPVATILKEQRARSAQELLVNLASSYQGGVKVQLPSDLIGQSHDKTTNPISSVLCPLASQSLSCPTAVILEPISISHPTTSTQASPLISPQKIISSVSDVKTIPSASSTLSNLLMGGPRLSEPTGICAPNIMPSPPVVSPKSSVSAQSIESPIIVADAKGLMYSLGNACAGKTLPKVSSLQQLLQGTTSKFQPLCSTPLQQNLVNVSNIKGHVVGPDVHGQTFLLVPNSESTIQPPNAAPLQTQNTSLMDTSSSPKQRHSLVSTINQNSGVSSAALLSELSQLASVSIDGKTKEPIIKHDSTISAFQKCEPNKTISDVDSGLAGKISNQTGETNLMSSKREDLDCEPLSCDQINDSQDIISDACLRKRKASKSQDDKSSEKKRHNTDNTGMGDLVVVEGDDTNHYRKENKEVVKEVKLLNHKTINESSLLTPYEGIINSDIEALLKLINSKSMTVKQTVIAMNTLKAQMKKSGLSVPLSNTNENELSVKGDEVMENSNQNSEVTGKSAKKIWHATRRNTSLNLESLESDALLDTELSLDRHLVEDMKHLKNGHLDHKTSVAVAAKSHHSHSSDKQKDHTRKSKDCNQLPSISPKAIQSYQMILNEKNKFQMDKDKQGLKASSEERTKVYCQKEGQKPQKRVQRRCISSVQDILQNRSRPSPKASGYQTTKSQSEVDAFDALLSKIHSNSLSSQNDNTARTHSSLVQDSELPIDIVDFVTESMSSRRDSLEGSSVLLELNKAKGTGLGNSNFDFSKQSVGARSISVPNTKPDFIDVGQSHSRLMSSSVFSNTPFGTEQTQLFIQPTAGDHLSTEEAGASAKDVFLSPIGPAKLARRSSVEKSISQAQIDRSVARMPTEMSSSSSVSQSPLNKERFMTDSPCDNSGKIQLNERHLRSQTPVDRALMSSQKHRSQTPIMQPVDKGYKSPISRALAKTPVEKCSTKQSSDPLPSRSELMFPIMPSMRGEESSFIQNFTSDTGYSSGSVSQTPNSDSGLSSVSQTPISDFGYGSVSPSPVMMSSAKFPGENGRNISPATIFMPLRSDSALSLNNNNIRPESPIHAVQSNHMELLSGFPNSAENQSTGTSGMADASTQNELKCERHSLPKFTSQLSEFPSSLLESLSSKTLLLNDMEGKEDGKCITSSSSTKTLLKLLTSSIQSIPTPPVSPSNSPPNTIPLPPGIPSPQLPYSGTSPLTLALSTAPCFLPGVSSSISTSSSFHNQQGHQFRPSPQFRGQDLPSPALASHNYTPSPQIFARPPSSPHQYSSHPSPPFTPCSLRSLPSPRCVTPISHKFLVSPRSVTPSSDPNQAAPNRFMPIQSSGVLPTSQTTTHTYIQPIRPVVALASACSGHNTNSDNTNSSSTQGLQNFIHRSSMHPMPQTSVSSSGIIHSVQSIRPMSSQSSSSTKSTSRGVDRPDAIITSEHKPLEANSVLVLSLSGDIGPLSNKGVDTTWGSTGPSGDQAPPKYTPPSGILSDLMHSSKDVGKINISQSSQKSSVIRSQSLSASSTLSHSQPHYTKPKDQSSPSILKLPKAQSNSNFSTGDSRSLINKTSYSSRAFKPPLTTLSTLSSPACSFKPVSISSSTKQHYDFVTVSQPSDKAMQNVQNALMKSQSSCSVLPGHHQGSESLQPSSTPSLLNHAVINNSIQEDVNNLNPTTQDELQATLDVLKDMDGQYFL